MRGPRSRAGLMAYPVVPPRDRPMRPDQYANQIGPEGRRGSANRHLLREDRGDAQHEHERADNLAEQVRAKIANRRHGGKARELQVGIFGFAPVRQEVQPHQNRARHGAEHLRHQKGKEFRKIAGLDRQLRRVTAGLRAASGLPHAIAAKTPEYHREGPAGGDRQPAGALGLRRLQQDVGDHAIAQQDQDRRPHEFTKASLHPC